MSDDKLADLIKAQKSLTEWLDDIKHSDAEVIRKEDNEKRERLKVLNEIIGLPYDKPTQFEATDLRDDNPAFTKFLAERGDELCALRIMPKKDGLPKLRIRGKTIKGAHDWFKEQDINPVDFRADFVPHPPKSRWATIFIVNQHGIQGEIIHGGHHQLTQGFHDNSPPIVFRYDFTTWQTAPEDKAAIEYLERTVQHIHITDKKKQQELTDKLGARFINDFLVGYFETSDSTMGNWYIDYNQALGDMYSDVIIRTDTTTSDAIVSGQTGSPGKAEGVVCIVDPDKLHIDFPDNGILVCNVTTPLYVPLMQKASAIVTDQGGILSHAAIVARELGTPCIVGTGEATQKLKSGETVVVDADAGVVVRAH